MATTDSSRSSFDDSSTASTSAHNSEPLSILQPIGYSSSSCGYCAEQKGMRSSKKGGRSYGCWAHVLTCKTYKDLINRGWRRSGKYLYKPDMRETCCPQYTISLDTEAFVPSKSQRQLLHRFSNFVTQGGREGTFGWGSIASPPSTLRTPPLPAPDPPTTSAKTTTLRPDSALSTAISVNFNPDEKPIIEDDDLVSTGSKRAGKRGRQNERGLDAVMENDEAGGGKGKGKGKGKNASVVDLVEMVHEPDWERASTDNPHKHRFEYKMEPASFTDEKYELFRVYQTQIHGEPDSKVTRKGFIRFLVDTPLEIEPTASPKHQYGSFHGLYILDGVLIAFAVLDVLPGAVSSVYFVWSPEWAAMGLGKVSALREAALVREMKRDGVTEMCSYMMGFYIHTCPKMAYKAAYQPSSLLDPATNQFYPWEHCKKYLDVDTHAAFSAPLVPKLPPDPRWKEPEVEEPQGEVEAGSSDEEDDDTAVWPEVPPPGCLNPSDLPKSIIMGTVLLESKSLVPLMFSSAWQEEETALEIRCILAALGDGLCRRVALYVG